MYNELISIINNNDIESLKKFRKRDDIYNFRLPFHTYYVKPYTRLLSSDPLLIAIKQNCSDDFIEIFLDLYYTFTYGSHNESPFYLAIKYKRFKLADYIFCKHTEREKNINELIEYNDFNEFFYGNSSSDGKILIYLLKKGLFPKDKKKIETLNQWIKNLNNEYLKTYFEYSKEKHENWIEKWPRNRRNDDNYEKNIYYLIETSLHERNYAASEILLNNNTETEDKDEDEDEDEDENENEDELILYIYSKLDEEEKTCYTKLNLKSEF
eukprot:jgi/Orpsp1_1/1176473/evm.model.c7180000057743.1